MPLYPVDLLVNGRGGGYERGGRGARFRSEAKIFPYSPFSYKVFSGGFGRRLVFGFSVEISVFILISF